MLERGWRNNWLKSASTLCVFLCVCLTILVPGQTQAGKLKDVIPGLYRGNGEKGFQVDLGTGGGGSTADFDTSSINDLNKLTKGIGSQLGQFAVASTVAGVRFDMERGIPVEETTSLGPLFSEIANTLGRGKFNLQVLWSHANYDKFNGEELSSIKRTAEPEIATGQNPGNEILRINTDINLITNFIGFYGTVGLTDNWDVNLLIPIVHTKLKATANATLIRDRTGVDCTQPGSGCNNRYAITGLNGTNSARDSRSAESTGIGDILLRSKLNVLRDHPVIPDLAVRGDVSFPTGDEDNFHGLGDFRFGALAIASKYYSSPIGMIGPHLNAGVSLVNNQSERNAFNYVAGFDVAPVPTVSVFLDLLGRRALNDKDDNEKDIVDLAPGFKWAPYPNTVVQAAVILPLNINDGLRANQIWTVGIGGTF